MGLKINFLLTDEEYLNLLEDNKYEDVFLSCKDYIQQKVNQYLKDFKYYHQYNDDFYHEVCIHVYSKSLPSIAFLEALRSGNSFRFYLAKTIRNTLNTLLVREKNKKENVLAFDDLCPKSYEDYDMEDKSIRLVDNSYHNQIDSQDLLDQVKEKFDKFLDNFQKVFPKIASKLLLLLKLQARVQINDCDLDACFPGISKSAKRRFIESLGDKNLYVEKDDKEIYTIIHPYFTNYRKEKGLPSSLQRWLNQHINGDKYAKGILDKLEIKDQHSLFRINDKKTFADFLFIFFEEKAKKEVVNISKITLKEKVFVLKPAASSQWIPSVSPFLE
jgi:DNA-directed RNA polymerase specialized sigma24 family protein